MTSNRKDIGTIETIIGIIVIVVVLLLACDGFYLISFITDSITSLWQGRAFGEQGSHYKTLCQNAVSLQSRPFPKNQGHRFVVVYADTGQTHVAFSRVEDAYRAKSPEDATTLVCVTTSQRRAGTYTDSAGAYAYDYAVSLIDIQNEMLVGQQTIYGDAPPSSKTSSGDRYGPEPVGKLARWLVTLTKP